MMEISLVLVCSLTSVFRVVETDFSYVAVIKVKTRMEGKAQRVAARALSPTRDN